MKVISVTLLPETSVPVQLLASPHAQTVFFTRLWPEQLEHLVSGAQFGGVALVAAEGTIIQGQGIEVADPAATGEGLP
jgi:hypothetical protein